MNEVNEEQNILDWFKEPIKNTGYTRSDMLTISKIERAAKIPATTLDKFLKERKYRSLSNHVKNLVSVLKQLGYEPIGNDE